VTTDIALVLLILAATIALFVSDRLRLDLVALLALLALTLTGIITPGQAAAGFGDTTVLLIAALFVVGEGLLQTGVAAAVGHWLERVAGTSELRIIITMMLVVTPMSAFISSTGAVAIMLPVVMTLAHRAGVSPSQVLIPLAYGALIGGMLTLIGTPPNLIASDALVAAGRPPLSFFSVTPVGVLVLAATLIVLVLVGRSLLPARAAAAPATLTDPSPISQSDLAAAYQVHDTLAHLRVRPTSSLVGVLLAESGLRERFSATVIATLVWSAKRQAHDPAVPARADTHIGAGDLLDLQVPHGQAERIAAELDLDLLPLPTGEGQLNPELLMLEVALTPRSRYIGQTVRDLAVRREFGVTVLGIQRLGQTLGGDIAGVPLRFGDTLLAVGATKALAPLVGAQRYYGDFVVATVPRALERQMEPELTPRAAVAVVITLAMLVLMATGWVSAMVAALAAALALVLTGCVRVADVYGRISWESLILIGAMLPMATALSQTGGTALIASALVDTLGHFGPLVLLAGVFVLTALFSQFISNTATAVLMMPIALESARRIGIAPEPLLVTAAIAASAAFATPIASPVNTLVLRAGGYRFADYARVGVPLQAIVLLICLMVVPLLFPF
jgi:di/tricarboxylate transporter